MGGPGGLRPPGDFSGQVGLVQQFAVEDTHRVGTPRADGTARRKGGACTFGIGGHS